MNPVDEFLKRLPVDAKEERSMVSTAFAITEQFKLKASDVRGNNRLSPIGQTEEIRKLGSGTPLQHLKQILGRAAAMAADTANQKKAFAIKPVDKADSFAEGQRRELRDFLRTLPAAERFRAVKEDKALAEAVLHAHPRLSGLTDEQIELVRQDHLERAYGPQLRGVEKREQVIAELNSALKVAAMQFRNETGLSEEEIA